MKLIAVFQLFLVSCCKAAWKCTLDDDTQLTKSGDNVEMNNYRSNEVGCIFDNYKIDATTKNNYAFDLKVENIQGDVLLGLSAEEALSSISFIGYFYNGNLTDGRAVYTRRFGDYFSLNEEDTVTFAVHVLEEKMNIYIIHKQTSLGMAYSIPLHKKVDLYPAVYFKGNGKVTYLNNGNKNLPSNRKLRNIVGKFSINAAMEGADSKHFCRNMDVIFTSPKCGVTESAFKDSKIYKVKFHRQDLLNVKITLERNENEEKWYYTKTVGNEVARRSSVKECRDFIVNLLQKVDRMTFQNEKLFLEGENTDKITRSFNASRTPFSYNRLTTIVNLFEDNSSGWNCDRFNMREDYKIHGESVGIYGDVLRVRERVCIYKGLGMTSGDYSFHLKVNQLKFNVALGVTNELGLSKQTGFFYDGDLLFRAYGGALRGFGNGIQKDDTVSFKVKLAGDNMKMFIKHQNQQLGLAYDVSGVSRVFYPAVVFISDSTTEVSYKNEERVGDISENRTPLELTGSYNMSKFLENEEEKSFSDCPNNVIEFSNDKGQRRVRWFKDESQRARLCKSGSSWTKCLIYDHVNKNSECSSFVYDVLNNCYDVSIKDNIVTLKSGGNKQLQATKVEEQELPAVTKNPFNF